MDEKRERKEGLNAFKGRQSKCPGCIEAGGQEGWTGDERDVKEEGIGLVSMEDLIRALDVMSGLEKAERTERRRTRATSKLAALKSEGYDVMDSMLEVRTQRSQ